MAKVAAIQTNVNAGELTPLLHGRPDLDKYGNGLKVCLNTIPLVQGGWSRRPGFIFAAEVKDSTKAVRVRRFEYSVTQAYVLAFGHQTLRFYKNDAAVLEAAVTITGATQASPVVITAVAHGYSTGDDVYLASIGGMTNLNGRTVRVTVLTANTFSIADYQGNSINGTAFTAYTSGGTAKRVYTIATDYDQADLFQLKFSQKNDVMWITHKNYAQRKLTRLADASWTYAGIDYLKGPYLDTNTTATTLTPSATTGAAITITASSITGINGGIGFQSGDVNRLVRIQHASTWGWAKITAVGSTTSVTAVTNSDFGAITASATWRLGLWSTYVGFPACSTFYEGRLAFAGAPAQPERVTSSRTGRYDDFQPTNADGTVLDDHAIDADLTSEDTQAIRWMLPDEKGLLCGTVNGEFVLRASAVGEAITPSNKKGSQATDVGSADIQAIRAGKAGLMVDSTATGLHEMAYVYTNDGFHAPDMSVLAEHITKGGMKEIVYQKHPQPVVWAPRTDGALLGMTYSREQSVIGWHRHEIGGVGAEGNPIQVHVESVTVIPSPDLSYHEVWIVTNRVIGGVAKRFIEYSAKPWERGDTKGEHCYLDCATYTVSDAGTSTIGPFWHLVGETVSIQAGGRVVPSQVVPASGYITLGFSCLAYAVGYAYESDGQVLRNNVGAVNGTAQGKTQRTHRYTLRLHETGQLMIGKDFDTLDELVANGRAYGAEELLLRSTEDITGSAMPMFSGDYTRPFEGDYTTDNTPCWRANGPLPATVLMFAPQLDTQDR